MTQKAPMLLRTQPLIVAGSGWEEAQALSVINEAAGYWFDNAAILIQPMFPREIVAPELLSTRRAPLRSELAGIASRHYTVFVQNVKGPRYRFVEGGSQYTDDGESLAVMLPFPSRHVSRPRDLVLAHEWGHTLDLPHHPLPFILMSCPFVESNFNWGFEDYQRQFSRSAARRNWTLNTRDWCIP